MEDDTPTTTGTGRISLEEEDSTDFRETKRLKTSHSERHQECLAEHSVAPTNPRYDLKAILPHSLKLLDVESASDENDHPVTREVDVGISNTSQPARAKAAPVWTRPKFWCVRLPLSRKSDFTFAGRRFLLFM